MRLKTLTVEVEDELQRRLEFLEDQHFLHVFESPSFPHLNSSISGSVDSQSTPTWYTKIHDAIEQTVVEYSKDDIENGQFFEMKMVLLPHSLDVYLYQPGKSKPDILLKLAATVLDIESGSFRFKSPLIREFQITHDEEESKSIA